MAKKKASRRRPAAESAVLPDVTGGPVNETEFGAETTGREIITFVDDSAESVQSALSAMKSRAGISRVCRMTDFSAESFAYEDTQGADAVVMEELGIAVVEADPDRRSAMSAMSASEDSNIIVEPEYINYTFSGLGEDQLDDDVLDQDPAEEPPAVLGGSVNVSADYLRGYQQGVAGLIQSLSGGTAAALAPADFQAAAVFNDTNAATWGLQATRVLQSNFSGRGIRVAVLDTGLDLNHPDFQGRAINSQSFIVGEAVQDGNGHGTHCIGTSCGSRRPGAGPRYGVAFNAHIFAGKVLSNGGRGSDGAILSGINWALRNRCQVISMSLGRRVAPGERPTRNYETAGRRALRAGTLIVAAAGNDSSRPSRVLPVSSPANAASIAAVAALDANLGVARFSNAGINPQGGEINLAGPGVQVHSSWPMPLRLRSISGTSMATPHVAGVAALVAEEVPSARGVQLYRELRRRARRLPLPRVDVGNGLVEAV